MRSKPPCERFDDTTRYERFSRKGGDGGTHVVRKAEGDVVLAVLKGWNSFKELRPKP